MSKRSKIWLFATLMALPVQAQATDIQIDPGLYAYATTLSVNGQVMLEDDYEYCLEPEDTNLSISEIVNDLEDMGQCEVSNVVVTGNHGEADITCTMPEMGGMTSTGHLKADYDRTYYKVTTDGRIGGTVQAQTIVDARRIGDCPAGWTPPPGISKD